MYVVVTGPPASGKSTVSRALAEALGWPLLAKDEIKQRLIAAARPGTVEESRELGREAVRLMLAEAAGMQDAVLDSVWVDRPRAVRQLAALGAVAEVFCRCDLDTLRRRFAARAPTKGAGHFDAQRTEEELWPEEALRPLAGGWRVIELDTTRDVEVAAVLREVWAEPTPG